MHDNIKNILIFGNKTTSFNVPHINMIRDTIGCDSPHVANVMCSSEALWTESGCSNYKSITRKVLHGLNSNFQEGCATNHPWILLQNLFHHTT